MTRDDLYRDVVGFEGLYEVNVCGEIFNKRTNRQMTPSKDTSGYPMVCLSKDKKSHSIKVSRIVAVAFIPNPLNKKTVNHIDGDKCNNAVWNLEWATYSDNVQHAIKTNLFKHKKVKIVETGQIFETVEECAKHINGQHDNIHRCLNGIRKTHKGFHFEEIC